jgi:hypothetical protein
LNSRHGTNYDHQYHQFNNQPSPSFVPPETSIEPTSSISEATSILHALEKRASTLQQERDKAERVYREAQLSVARHRALCGQMHNSKTPLISQLPVELLIHIFLFLQNTVVASQVCRYWRVVALSCPKLWSSLHVHPSKGSKHLENLLARSLGQNIDVCFCPVPTIPRPPIPRMHMNPQLSLPPMYTQQYHPDMCLTPHVVSILEPHTHRLRSFELHATVPGTWLALLPMLQRQAPNLRTLHIYTKLPQDVAQLNFFGSHTPQLRNVQITGAFPLLHPGLLRNLTFLRLESVPVTYRPTTAQLIEVLKSCPDLVSLSLLDAGPVQDTIFMPPPTSGGNAQAHLELRHLQALAFRDTEIQLSPSTLPEEGMVWFFQHVHTPKLAALHIMLAPHPLALPSRAPIPTPYPHLSPGAAPQPISAAIKLKTTTVLQCVPTLDCLEELYLWAPHATHEEIGTMLSRMPALRTLEIPFISEPVETLGLFSRPISIMTDSADSVDGKGQLTSPDIKQADSSLGSTGQSTLSKRAPAEDDVASPHLHRTEQQKSRWLCPNLERIGIPFINGAEQKDLEHALKNVFTNRSKTIRSKELSDDNPIGSATLACDEGGSDTRGVKKITALLAPTGQPTYVCTDVWQWIAARASILTMLPGQAGMDMLFDQITRDNT